MIPSLPPHAHEYHRSTARLSSPSWGQAGQKCRHDKHVPCGRTGLWPLPPSRVSRLHKLQFPNSVPTPQNKAGREIPKRLILIFLSFFLFCCRMTHEMITHELPLCTVFMRLGFISLPLPSVSFHTQSPLRPRIVLSSRPLPPFSMQDPFLSLFFPYHGIFLPTLVATSIPSLPLSPSFL